MLKGQRMSGEAYKIGASITWFLIFIGSYIYCIAEYGFLLGVGLGWRSVHSLARTNPAIHIRRIDLGVRHSTKRHADTDLYEMFIE